jgi:two-component system sensor histidine kinase DesK
LRGLLPRLWPFFVAFWLVALFANPVALMLDGPLTPWRVLGTLAWTVTFLTAYLWLLLHKPFRAAEVTATERRVQIGLLIVLAGLVLYADLAYPPGLFWLFIYVVLPAGIVLPTRAAIWTTIVVTALAAGIDLVRLEWSVVGSVLGVSVWGIVAIMFRRLVVTVDELRTARVELARLAVSEERLRIARDLHDLLGHSLSVIALKSELAGRLAPRDGARAVAEIADIERVARRSLRDVREAVAGYRRPTLADELAGVGDLLAAAGIETRIDAAPGPLPPAIDAALAWVVREGATNVIRHSGARRCRIRVVRTEGGVHVEVIDDGRGVAGRPTDAGGSGLRGLAERAAALDGQMTAGADEAGGFCLRVDLPLGGDPPGDPGQDASSVTAHPGGAHGR